MTVEVDAGQAPVGHPHPEEHGDPEVHGDRGPRTGRVRRPWPVLVTAVVFTAVVCGTYARLSYVANQHTNSDYSVVGLMAMGILHGHFGALYWGQAYGGVEPYVVAVVFGLFGTSATSLGLTAILLVAVASVLTWRVGLRLVTDRWLAVLAATFVWVVPAFGITTARECGFRNAALVCGVAALLLALRILDGHRSSVQYALFGLVVGVGWWASPEIVYLALPAVALVIGALLGSRSVMTARDRAVRTAACGAGFVVGALPWLWANAHSGFLSLNAAATSAPTDGSYLDHLRVFLVGALPFQLGVRKPGDDAFLLPGGAGFAIAVVACTLLVGAALVCMLRPGRSRVIGVALLAFPFLYAVDPLAAWWEDGRYSVNLPVLAGLAFAIACEEVFRRIPAPGAHRIRSARDRRRPPGATGPGRARALLTALVVVSLLLAVVGYEAVSPAAPRSIGSDPNRATEQAIATLERMHVHTGYAAYWIAYTVDYLSGGQLAFTPAPGDQARSEQILHEVEDTPTGVAWLFVPAESMHAARLQFGSTDLQTGYDPESDFTYALRQHGDPYGIVHTPLFDAVIPRRPVTPAQMGMRPPG